MCLCLSLSLGKSNTGIQKSVSSADSSGKLMLLPWYSIPTERYDSWPWRTYGVAGRADALGAT